MAAGHQHLIPMICLKGICTQRNVQIGLVGAKSSIIDIATECSNQQACTVEATIYTVTLSNGQVDC